MSSLKRTPLFDLYEKWGAKTIDFSGWEMPVQFSGIKKEHEFVRTKSGLFDVSHMGEILVTGQDAEAFLQKMLTNDLSKLKINKAQYSILCNEKGGTIDDLLVYRLGDNSYLLVVNAGNIEKDFKWLKKHVTGNVRVENASSSCGLVALQGPLSEEILQKLTKNIQLSSIPPFGFKKDVQIDSVKALVSRTGYTGEDGFEIYCKWEDTPFLWNKILESETEERLLPCGLGARDTLRFEAGLPLYGQELSEGITPIEAGIGFAVKTKKTSDFIGKDVLHKQATEGASRKIVGIEMIERGIPRNGYKVFADGKEIGRITSGTQSPTLKKNVGMALIQAGYANLGGEIELGIRNKRLRAKIVPLPFYRRQK